MMLFCNERNSCVYHTGDYAAKCTSGFPFTLTSEENLDLNFTQLLDAYTGGVFMIIFVS